MAEGRHPEESVSTEGRSKTGSNSNSSSNGSVARRVEVRPVVSPASTVQTSKSNPGSSGKRRKGKPGIKFLKRALSSPPVLLQRFHSNPIEKHRNSSDNTNNKFRLPHAGSSSSNSSTHFDVYLNANNNNHMAERTTVVPNCYSPASKPTTLEPIRTDLDDEDDDDEVVFRKSSCNATSILHHTYFPVLETICGSPDPDALRDNFRRVLPPAGRSDLRQRYYSRLPADAPTSIPEDPTVQESIECIFASQLEDGLELWDDDDEHDDDSGDDGNPNKSPRGHRSFESLEKMPSASSASVKNGLVSPAGVQQSRMNRKDRRDSTRSLFDNMPQTKKRYEQASLVYVGTFDPSTPKNRSYLSTATHRSGRSGGVPNTSFDGCDASTVYSNLPTDPLPCSCATSFLPYVEPSAWPQAPIALRPTPGSGTIVKSIRFSGSAEPLWVPGSHLTWSQRLREHWGRPAGEEPHYATCEECVVLPINNGNEALGESLVVDFESDLFVGTMMLRLRYSNGTTPEPYDDTRGYFAGMNRRYQLCIRGRFKKVIPFTELTTGFRMGREFGKLPSKWIVKGAVKVVSFFAPQLDIKLDGVTRPYSNTPLGSTPQCINVDDGKNWDGRILLRDSDDDDNSDGDNAGCGGDPTRISNARMNELDGIRVESTNARRSILGIAGTEEHTSLQRSKTRKKAFDKLYAGKSQGPKTDPSKVYTFEFLQHMVNFQDFSLELGSVLGSVKLAEMLDGQPLPIMASHGDQHLWSFDVWNECLWKQAAKHDAMAKQRLLQQQQQQQQELLLRERCCPSSLSSTSKQPCCASAGLS